MLARKTALLLISAGMLTATTDTRPAWAGVVNQRGTPPIVTQLGELRGSGADPYDWLGASVAVSGGTIVAGAPAVPLISSGQGRAYVSTITATGWHQSADLEGSGTVAHDWFGDSVAISGRTIVVGAPAISVLTSGIGRVYVFTKTATGWHQSADLEGPGAMAGDTFGVSVAISASTIVVGAPSHASKAGAAYVFTKAGGVWHVTELKGSDTVAKDDFGGSVAIAGRTIVVGAFGHASDAGRAYVFARTARSWRQAAELSGSDTVVGDSFGASVAISGSTIVVGAGLASSDAGRAYVFTRTTTGWHQTAELESPASASGGFGDAVATSGNIIVVGATDYLTDSSRAFVFTKTAMGWGGAELHASDTLAHDWFGASVAVSGTIVAVGAYGHASGTGRAYLFRV